MSKIAVVFWSGTGNTEAMAEKVEAGAREAGAEVRRFQASDFSPEQAEQFDALAFGCPSMGNEELEDTEFAPMFQACESRLRGKPVALFGSYGWGDGEWMRNWEESCRQLGALLRVESVTCCEAPDAAAEAACAALGAALARSL